MDGEYQEWQIGFQGQINLGFRREMAGVRNAQLDLAKEQVKLQEGELELSHQLAYAVRDLESNYVICRRPSIAARPPRISSGRRGHLRAAWEKRRRAPPSSTTSCGPNRSSRRPRATTIGRWSTIIRRSPRSTIARARCWSTMACTWPRGRGLARRISTPAAAPAPARHRRWTTASRSRGWLAAGRSSRTRAGSVQRRWAVPEWPTVAQCRRKPAGHSHAGAAEGRAGCGSLRDAADRAAHCRSDRRAAAEPGDAAGVAGDSTTRGRNHATATAVAATPRANTPAGRAGNAARSRLTAAPACNETSGNEIPRRNRSPVGAHESTGSCCPPAGTP